MEWNDTAADKKAALSYLDYLLRRAEAVQYCDAEKATVNGFPPLPYIEPPAPLLQRFKLEDLAFNQSYLQLDEVLMKIQSEASGFDFSSMREWQLDCLYKHLLQQKNLLIIAGTASGKTYVSTAFALYCLIVQRKSVIFAAPFITIVNELVQQFSLILTSRYGLCGLSGLSPIPQYIAHKPTMYVCTLEKAFVLARQIYEDALWDKFGLVIVDELQIVGEQGDRSSHLELMMNYMLLMQWSQADFIRIITMSATISNLDDITKWLGADLYKTDFTTQKIQRIIIKNDSIFNYETRKEIAKFRFNYQVETRIYCKIAIIATKPLLVFVPTKNICSYMAEELSHAYDRIKELQSTDAALVEKRLYLLAELQTKQFSVKQGIAYHNASLSGIDRQNIEEAYKEGVLHTIIATSTLAAGVNLPAVSVFIFYLKVGKQALDSVKFKQMQGRAGRFKSNPNGMLIIYSDDVFKELDSLSNEFQCSSQLFNDVNKVNSMNAILVNAITFDCNFVPAFQKTLYFVQKQAADDLSFKDNIDFLTKIKFLLQNNGKQKITSFGAHANKAGLMPYQAYYLQLLIQRIQSRGINPFDKVSILLFAAQFTYEQLQFLYNHSFDQFLQNELAPFRFDKNDILIQDQLLLNMLDINTASLQCTSNVYILSQAIAISTAIQRKADENLLKSAAAMLSMVVQFAELEGMPIMPVLKQQLDEIRALFQEDITSLLEIRGVGVRRAQKLKQAGFNNYQEILAAGIDQLKLRCSFGEMTDAICGIIWGACQEME